MGLITLEIVSDIFGTPNKQGVQQLIKKDAKCSKTFESHLISVEHSFNKKGEIDKKHCMIQDGEKYYKVAHTFEYVERLIKPVVFNGFKIKGNNDTKKLHNLRGKIQSKAGSKSR
jgi:hypothetical protein